VEAQQIVQQRGGRPRRSGCGLAMSTLHGAGFRVFDKGGKKRSVPIDADVAGAIQTYLLAERPETAAGALFIVANGSCRFLDRSAE